MLKNLNRLKSCSFNYLISVTTVYYYLQQIFDIAGLILILVHTTPASTVLCRFEKMENNQSLLLPGIHSFSDNGVLISSFGAGFHNHEE
jgi:hypothetical protein